MDGNTLLTRIREGDLDSIDVGDFLDRYLNGEDPTEGDIPALDVVARDFAWEMRDLIPGATAIEAWRAVIVQEDPDEWAANPVGQSGIGMSWSLDRSGAAPYGGGYGGVRRLLHGRVRAMDVDWAATCIMNAVKPEQHEIRLLETAHVEVVGIYDGETMLPLACRCVGSSFPAFVSPEARSAPSHP